MAELNLEWIEAGKLQTRVINPTQVTKTPGMTRIGRDPSRCDIVLSDGSVSGLHIQIGYEENLGFFVDNLRDSNPPIVNQQPLINGRIHLEPENTIQLGNLQLRAIATQPEANSSIPATEIQIPLPATPALSPPEAPPPFQEPANSTPIHSPKLNSSTHQGLAPPESSSPAPTSKGKNIFIFLLLSGILIALFTLAWPSIRAFLGIGSSTVIDDSVSSERQQDTSSGTFINYQHPSGLYSLDVPENWTSLDNSQDGEIVIQGWHHPELNSYVIIRIFATDVGLSRPDLEDFSEQVVDDLFGGLDNFQRGSSEPLLNGSVRVLWEANDGNDRLIASSFVQQVGLNLSTTTIWSPENASSFDNLNNILNQTVASLEVNPNIDIP